MPDCSLLLIPREVCDDPMCLEDYILGHHDDLDMTLCEARSVVGALPPPLRAARCFCSRRPSIQEYEYGKPWDLPHGQMIVGSGQVLPVKKLTTEVQAALRYLVLSRNSSLPHSALKAVSRALASLPHEPDHHRAHLSNARCGVIIGPRHTHSGPLTRTNWGALGVTSRMLHQQDVPSPSRTQALFTRSRCERSP